MRNVGILLSVHKLNEKPSRWSMMTVLKKAPDNYAKREEWGGENLQVVWIWRVRN